MFTDMQASFEETKTKRRLVNENVLMLQRLCTQWLLHQPDKTVYYYCCESGLSLTILHSGIITPVKSQISLDCYTDMLE